jgi:hypothetical protein
MWIHGNQIRVQQMQEQIAGGAKWWESASSSFLIQVHRRN